jgi:peptidoglycan/LPS O-acetylase OafA/YrhL
MIGNKLSFVRRPDIEGLRALAVLTVVCGHLFPTKILSGYLGVDVFFVISGFVITQLIFQINSEKNLMEGLIEFYSKRIRRLAPALVVVTTISLIFIFALMTRPGEEITRTGAFALFGVSNMYLWHLSNDYFGIAASQNPYTHTWSLGVEEQFYFIYPFLLIILTRGFRLISRKILILCLSFLSVVSLSFSASLSPDYPELNFYSMPTRFWEFGAGTLVFFLGKVDKLPIRIAKVFQTSLVLLIFTFTLLEPTSFLAWQLIIVTLTCLILYFHSDANNSNILCSSFMVWIGKRSYSIYLIHWPILVISNYVIGESEMKNLLILAPVFLFSHLSYKYIENPFRIGRYATTPSKTYLVGIPVILILFGLVFAILPRYSQSYNNILPNLMGVSRVPIWEIPPCSGAQNISKMQNPVLTCLGKKSSLEKTVYLVGDSHADHLLGMVTEAFSNTKYQVRNLNMGDGIDFPYSSFQQKQGPSSLKFIEQKSSQGDIVVLAFHRGLLNPTRDAHLSLETTQEVTDKTKNLIFSLNSFAANLRNRGVTLILVRDTPLMNSVQTSEACSLQLKLFSKSGCRVPRVLDIHTRYLQDLAFSLVDHGNRNVLAWDPLPYLYGSSEYLEVLNEKGEYLMWDWNHITQDTSKGLAPFFQMDVLREILTD